MRTSREIRAEAKRLFFSDPGAWYCVGAKWLRDGGHPNHTWRSMDFLAYVERLSIKYVRLDNDVRGKFIAIKKRGNNTLDNDTYTVEAVTSQTTEIVSDNDRIGGFWQTVHRLFPRVKHVVLWEEYVRSPDKQPPESFKKVANMCPLDIHVSFALLYENGSRGDRVERKTWQRSTSRTDTQEWMECANNQGQLVNLPYKKFRGPVGEFGNVKAVLKEELGQNWAIEVHEMAAIEKFHFGDSAKPFGCCVPDCDAWFAFPGDYTTHAINTHHNTYHELPEPFQSLFAENKQRMNCLEESSSRIEKRFREWFGKTGSQQRSVAEKEFIYQLEHDPMYAQDRPILEHPVLKSLYKFINRDF